MSIQSALPSRGGALELTSQLSTRIRLKDEELHALRHRVIPTSIVVSTTDSDGLLRMRKEMERLKMRVREVEEENIALREGMDD